MSPKSEKPVIAILEELRRRIIISLIIVFIAFAISFAYSDFLIKIILRPYGEGFHPVVLAPTERIMNFFKVSMAAGLIISSPFIVAQIWGFVAPALLSREKKYIFPVLPVIIFLFAIGTAFGYFLVLPTALKFLMNLGGSFISNQIRLDSAISFVVQICLVCGLVFQLPVIIFLLSKVGIVTASFLQRQRKSAIIAIFIAAALLTPTPDPITMTIVAAPMLLLYEVSIWVSKISNPSMKQKDVENGQSFD